MSTHCEHGERCGGCTLLGVPEAEQLRRKHERVVRAMIRYPALGSIEVEPVAAAHPTTEYRTRAKLMVSPRGEIGLFARGSHEIVDIPRCRVLTPEVAAVVSAVRTAVQPGLTRLASLDVRETKYGGQTGVLVTLGGDVDARAELSTLTAELSRLPQVAGVALREHGPRTRAFSGGAPSTQQGASSARDSLLPDGPYHLATHGAFTQAHRGQAEVLARRVIGELEATLSSLRGARVLELYAGSGALGLALCSRGARCLLVEQLGPALALAERSAQEQRISGLHTREGDALEVTRALAAAGERVDAVIVNPPRRGLPAALRASIAALAPRVLVYVSCEPETLARDASHLRQLGYGARTLLPYDMMPLTDSVETLAVLRPTAPPEIAVCYEDEDLLAVHKPPHLATTPQGGQPSSLLERVRDERNLPDVAAVHRLDVGTSGVCLLAKHKSAVAGLGAALAAGQKQYLALVRGVTRDKGSVRRPLRDADKTREARTRYTRMAVHGGHSLLRVRPDEGRTHQIRRHLAAIGHPVLGDGRYGDAASNRHFEHEHGLDRPFLHLTKIELTHPKTQHALVLESALAGDLAAVCDHLQQGAR